MTRMDSALKMAASMKDTVVSVYSLDKLPLLMDQQPKLGISKKLRWLHSWTYGIQLNKLIKKQLPELDHLMKENCSTMELMQSTLWTRAMMLQTNP